MSSQDIFGSPRRVSGWRILFWPKCYCLVLRVGYLDQVVVTTTSDILTLTDDATRRKIIPGLSANSVVHQRMASWDSFPREIRVRILERFCADVICDLTGLAGVFNGTGDLGLLHCSVYKLERASWPPEPVALKSFISALATCHEFHYIISQEAAFGRMPAIEFVRACQVKGISNMLLNTNPDAFGSQILTYVLQCSNRHLHPLLIPQLEGPLMYHFDPRRIPRWVTPDRVCLSSLDYKVAVSEKGNGRGGGDDDQLRPAHPPGRESECRDDLQVQAKLLSMFSTFKEDGDRCSVIALLTGIDIQGPLGPCTALADIAASLKDQWWAFFPDYDGDYNTDKAFGWILVNYKAERMYLSTNPSEALCWRGRDIWRMNTWARLNSLEDIRTHYASVTPSSSDGRESCVIC